MTMATGAKYKTNCVICDKQDTYFSWTDTHGVAQCCICGAPYVLLHYEGEGENRTRVEKAPACVVLPGWVPLLRRYRAETGHLIPGGHSLPGGYELARPDDFRAFKEWCDENRAAIDALKSNSESSPLLQQGG